MSVALLVRTEQGDVAGSGGRAGERYNRRQVIQRQVAREEANGKVYRKTSELSHRPPEEWIAVPVPDAGIPPEIVEVAREVLENNARPSAAGERSWELSGGILRCGVCSLHMRIRSASNGKGATRRYYYTCGKSNADKTACHHRKNHRAIDLEAEVWDHVSSLMKDPKQLRDDLKRMIELKRESLRGDPDREAKAWLEELSEVNSKRAAFQAMAAEGLISSSRRLRPSSPPSGKPARSPSANSPHSMDKERASIRWSATRTPSWSTTSHSPPKSAASYTICSG